MSDQRKCYLCGSCEYITRPGRVRDIESLKILECMECGLVYLSKFDHIDKEFYEDSGMHPSTQPIKIVEWLKDTEKDDERRYQYLKNSITNRTLLDFGCGVGGFLLKSKDTAYRVVGLELEKRLQPYYKQKGILVFPNLDELKNKHNDNKFELITMFHVMEHLKDPVIILEQLASLLSTDGQIIIEVPNANDILLKIYENEAFSRFTYWSCHLFLYTSETLGKLAKKAGLKVNYTKQIQRYPLSNHLYWLEKGKPGGHQKWSFLDSEELNHAYENQLAALGCCDTVIASFSRHKI